LVPGGSGSSNDTKREVSSTRITRKTLLACVRMEILGVYKNYPFVKATDKQGVKSTSDLFSITEEDILALKYNDNGVKTPIQRTPMSWIRTIQAWNLELIFVHGMQINWMDQQNIDKD